MKNASISFVAQRYFINISLLFHYLHKNKLMHTDLEQRDVPSDGDSEDCNVW